MCRLCPFCDKKNAIRAQIRQNKFYSVNICSQATHCRRYLAPRCIAKGTDTSHLTVHTPLSCHGSFLSPLCCISSSARTPLPPSLPFGKLLLQKPSSYIRFPAAVCSYRYYSFAAAALSSTHLQHHFRISKITYSTGLRRFELHITNGEAPLRGASFFIYLIIFNAFSLFIIRAQAQADTLPQTK